MSTNSAQTSRQTSVSSTLDLGQTHRVREYTQVFNESCEQVSPDLSSKSRTEFCDYTADSGSILPSGLSDCRDLAMTHHNKPFNELYRATNPEEALPKETPHDEDPDNSFCIFQDDQEDNASLCRSENEENVAPDKQELTATFALGPNTPISVHKETIYLGCRKEAQQEFTTSALPRVITIAWSIRYTGVRRQSRTSYNTNRRSQDRPAYASRTRPPMASSQGIGKRHSRKHTCRAIGKSPFSIGSDRPSTAERGRPSATLRKVSEDEEDVEDAHREGTPSGPRKGRNPAYDGYVNRED